MTVGTQVNVADRARQPHRDFRHAGGGQRGRPHAPGGADLVDFGAGEPHFNTPEHVKEAAIAAIQANFTKYTPVGGTAELRDAIVQRHAQDFGSAYKREDCIASAGGKHALFNAIQVLVDHGDEVILPVPHWVSFKDIVRYAGGVPVFVETDEGKVCRLADDGRKRHHPADQGHRPEFAVEPVRRGDDAGGLDRVGALAAERGI